MAIRSVPNNAVTLMWMDTTRLVFRYVPGTRVPGMGPVRRDDNRPSTWVKTMIAGFNGGFQLRDHAGGYIYAGHTVVSLVPGFAAFVIRANGGLTVGVPGRGLVLRSGDVVVRQNLHPLVWGGASQTSPQDGSETWGRANGGLAHANRSALGQRPDGSTVFAFGAMVTAPALASALISAGVTTAMALDMNVSWPTGFVYTHHGTTVTGKRISKSIVRPPDTYLQRFQKDFIAVLRR